ncbi:MAG: ATP-binding protein [Methanospirillum sp.]
MDPAAPHENVVFVALDITNPHEKEAALRESEARFRAFMDNSPAIAWIKDEQGRHVYLNRTYLGRFGVRPEERIGKTDFELGPPEVARQFQENARIVLATGQAIQVTEETPAPDGGLTSWWNFKFPLQDASGRRFVGGIGIDITERREAEERLKEYAADPKRSNEELERFAYVSSHDLQEPLRSIVSFSQLLDRRYKGRLDQDADEYIAFIVEGGPRMQSLIQDLLAFSRVNTTKQELARTDTVDVFAGVERSLDVQPREAGAAITHDPVPVVMADPLQLEQVLTNLVSNAIKFRRPDEPLQIHVGARRMDGFREFSVSDNGIGIAPEYFDRIFVIFQRVHTKETYPGTGIGLAIVKRIVDRHGGTIRVESTPGEGKTFFFTFPAA